MYQKISCLSYVLFPENVTVFIYRNGKSLGQFIDFPVGFFSGVKFWCCRN